MSDGATILNPLSRVTQVLGIATPSVYAIPTTMSMTFVPVGPVLISASAASRAGYES